MPPPYFSTYATTLPNIPMPYPTALDHVCVLLPVLQGHSNTRKQPPKALDPSYSYSLLLLAKATTTFILVCGQPKDRGSKEWPTQNPCHLGTVNSIVLVLMLVSRGRQASTPGNLVILDGTVGLDAIIKITTAVAIKIKIIAR